MQKKSSVFLIFVFWALAACSLLGTPSPAPPATSLENTIRFKYRNVSLVTPPFLSNKITAEELDLREQRDPADAVPGFIQIDLREPWDTGYEDGLYSQVLVYPLADLVLAYPQSAAESTKLQNILKQNGQPLPQDLPFWPLTYYSQVSGAPLRSYGTPVFSVQSQRLDFASGHGLRYVTLLDAQPPRQTRMEGLIYTFQGLTDEGQYYVSVILPIDIPHEDTLRVNLENLAKLSVPDYGGIAKALSTLRADQFYLTLADCDGLVKSLVVGK